MSYNVQALKADLEGTLHGTTLNQITNIDALINRAARELLLEIDPQETKRIVQFVNPIYDNVYTYAVPTDLKGNAIIDIRPQVNRTPLDRYLAEYNQSFDIFKDFTFQPNFTIQFNNGVKTIRIDAPFLNSGIVINDASNTTQNGTWAVGGNANTLSNNTTNYVAGGGSIQFNLTVLGSSGYVENSTMATVDLSARTLQGQEMFYTYIPTGSGVTSINLRWGSSSTNYWSSTVTTTQEGLSFQNGWNLLSFDWSTASVTGSPVASAVNYVRVTYNFNGTAQTGVLLNNVISRLGTILETEYYSKYLFRDAVTGGFQETVTDDSNLINLDTESYNILFYLVGVLGSQQQQGLDAVFFDGNFFKEKYENALTKYRARYKSEIQKPRSFYYKQTNPSARRFFGRRNSP